MQILSRRCETPFFKVFAVREHLKVSGNSWRILGSPKIGIVLGERLKTYLFKRPPSTIPILVVTVAVPTPPGSSVVSRCLGGSSLPSIHLSADASFLSPRQNRTEEIQQIL